MNNTTRMIVFLVIAAAAFGAWTVYQKQGGSVPTVTISTGKNTNSAGGESGTMPAGTGTPLTLVTSATKKGWLEAEVERYNALHDGHVQIKYLETRAAMHDILGGKIQPNLWSPSAPLWANRLSEAWAAQHGGEPLVSAGDPNAYRVYLRTPIVFVTTKDKTAFLRPLLSSTQSWENLSDLSNGRKKLPGVNRPFVWAHADPLNSNSGFLTIGLLLDAYARKNGSGSASAATAQSPGFAAFLQSAERTLPLNESVRAGSTQLMADFVANPGHYDVITAYESSALEAAQSNANLAVLYPTRQRFLNRQSWLSAGRGQRPRRSRKPRNY